MNCATALDRLLEADLAETAARGESELAQHLRTCDRCRAVADRILADQQALGRAIAEAEPRTPVDEALRSAAGRVRLARRRRKIWRVTLPAAAAAGLAGILVFGGGGQGALDSVWEGTMPQPATGLDIQAPAGRDFLVFEVQDRPDIVVVWFFDRGEG